MAKSSSTSRSSQTTIVELTLVLNARGRSVVHGTLTVDSEMVTVKHELDSVTKDKVGSYLLANIPGLQP